MTRRAAFRQCDVVRALKAAKVVGAGRVIVRRDGTLEIELKGDRKSGEAEHDIEPIGANGLERDIVL